MKQKISLALQNISRHRWISIATMIVISLLIIIFNLAVVLGGSTQKMISNANDKVDMLIQLNNSAEPYQIDHFISEIKVHDEVVSAKLLTPEEGMGIFQTMQPKLYEALQRYEIVDLKKAFPYTVSIKVTSPESHNVLNEYFREEKSNIVNLSSLSDMEDNNVKNLSASAASELIRLVSTIKRLFGFMISIFLIVALSIITNSIYISLYTRQEEIAIMRLVGAKYSSIRLPYIIEGVLLAIFAVVFGNIIFSFVAIFASWSENFFNSSLYFIIFIQLVLAGFIGALASSIATNKFLKKQKLLF